MRFLHFILAHSIFVAFCAVGLCYQTNVLLYIKADVNIYFFVFFSTVCGYNFYWFLSKLHFSKRVLNITFIKANASYIFIFFASLVATIYFLILLQNIFKFILIGIILTLLYSMPLWSFNFAKKVQRVGFVKTFLLAFTWAFVTTVLPANFLLNANFKALLLLLIVRFSFMLLLCIVFDMRDIFIDKVHELHSLVTDVSKKSATNLVLISLVIFITSAFVFCFQYSNPNQAIAFLFTAILFWFMYKLSLKQKGYIFYYFLVDGLMILTAAATYALSLL